MHEISQEIVKDPFINKIKRIATCTLLFVISYLLAWAIQHYTTSALLLMFDYKPHITFNDNANLPSDYRQWSYARINIIFSGGSLLCFIIGLIFYFTLSEFLYSVIKMFLIYFTICCINVFLGFLLFSPFGINQVGTPLYKGYAVIGTWWRMGEVVFLVMAVLAALIAVIFGYMIRNELLKFSYSGRMNKSIKGRNAIIAQFYLFPVLFSLPLVVLLATNQSLLIHFFLYANLMLWFAGMFLGNEYDNRIILARKEDVLNKIPVAEFLLTVLIYFIIWAYLK